MVRDELLKQRWEELVELISKRFADGDRLDLDAIIYLIGLQEFGRFDRKFKKMINWISCISPFAGC